MKFEFSILFIYVSLKICAGNMNIPYNSFLYSGIRGADYEHRIYPMRPQDEPQEIEKGSEWAALANAAILPFPMGILWPNRVDVCFQAVICFSGPVIWSCRLPVGANPYPLSPLSRFAVCTSYHPRFAFWFSGPGILIPRTGISSPSPPFSR